MAIEDIAFQPAPGPINVVPTLGAGFIGVAASNVLWGVNGVLAYQYYGHFANDPPAMKLLVAWVALVETIFTISTNQVMWFWTVAQWGNVVALNDLGWGWPVLVVSITMLEGTVQAYFALRIYILSQMRNWWLSIIIALAAVSEVGWGCAVANSSIRLKHPSKLDEFEYGVQAWLYTAAANDIVILVSMLWYMNRYRSEIPSSWTNIAFSRWTKLALETNSITSAAALAAVLLFQFGSKKALIYFALYVAAIRIYFLSLLSTLNSRRIIAEQTRSGSHAYPTPIGTPRNQTMSIHQTGSLVSHGKVPRIGPQQDEVQIITPMSASYPGSREKASIEMDYGYGHNSSAGGSGRATAPSVELDEYAQTNSRGYNVYQTSVSHAPPLESNDPRWRV